MAREYLRIFHSDFRATRRLSDAEFGRLIRALGAYSQGSSEFNNLQGREEILFDVYSQRIDDENAAYEQAAEAHRVAGSKGGRPKKQNGSAESKDQTINQKNQIGFSKTKITNLPQE